MRLDPLCFDVSRFVSPNPALSRNTLALLTVVSFGVSRPCCRWCPTPASPAAPEPLQIGPPGPSRQSPPQDSSPRRRPPAQPPFQWRRTGARATETSVTSTPSGPTPTLHYVHDGEQEYFVHALDRRAPSAPRSRGVLAGVHRSYIVSVDRIAQVATGEAGVAELGLPVRCSIPIARAHYRQVKLRSACPPAENEPGTMEPVAVVTQRVFRARRCPCKVLFVATGSCAVDCPAHPARSYPRAQICTAVDHRGGRVQGASGNDVRPTGHGARTLWRTS